MSYFVYWYQKLALNFSKTTEKKRLPYILPVNGINLYRRIIQIILECSLFLSKCLDLCLVRTYYRQGESLETTSERLQQLPIYRNFCIIQIRFPKTLFLTSDVKKCDRFAVLYFREVYENYTLRRKYIRLLI